MSVVITEDISVADIDEAIRYTHAMMKTDEFGNRMNWRKREMLQSSIDDLLDARLALIQRGTALPSD
jgi:hypothetical protein